jgi:tetratricopeptide (TPR) repeat protein
MKKIEIVTARGCVGKTIIFVLSVFVNLHSQQKSSVLLNNDILVMKTEGISFLGSGMNEADAKTFAINDAKRNALEQAGTYLESHTTVLNYQLVKDEVITFSAGLVKVKVLNEERKLVNSMFALKVDIEATIDIKLLDERIKEIRSDSDLRQQLEAEKERNKRLETKIAELQVSGSTAHKQTVKNVLNELSASEWLEKGLKANFNLKIEYFTKAIELNPQYVEAYIIRGFTYWRLAEVDKAIQDCNRGIELNPQYAYGYFVRGTVNEWQGKHDTAIQDYNRAIELNPQYVEAYSARGWAYGAVGKFDMVVRDYTIAIKLKPQNPRNATFYSYRGNAYRNLGEDDKAIQDFNRAIMLDPQNASFYFWRSIAYEDINNKQAAAEDLNSYLRIKGNKNDDAERTRQRIRDLGYTPEY